ncbi:hypothetical protein [Embleya sp. AB8]|uniref:hypothetical protein n=1 Tax=Embleya sp. AB8 TaxID=3156304 RepID=UPI003C70ADF2
MSRTSSTASTLPTNHNRRQLIDGVLWESKPMRVLLVTAFLPVAFGLLDIGDLGLSLPVSIGIWGGLSLFVLLGYALYQYRKLSIGPHGLVFHGLFRTRGLRWEEIASVDLKLKGGGGETPGYAVARCAMRDGDKKQHTINFLDKEMLPYLAVDLRWYAASREIPVRLLASDDLVRTVDMLESGAPR